MFARQKILIITVLSVVMFQSSSEATVTVETGTEIGTGTKVIQRATSITERHWLGSVSPFMSSRSISLLVIVNSDTKQNMKYKFLQVEVSVAENYGGISTLLHENVFLLDQSETVDFLEAVKNSAQLLTERTAAAKTKKVVQESEVEFFRLTRGIDTLTINYGWGMVNRGVYLTISNPVETVFCFCKSQQMLKQLQTLVEKGLKIMNEN